MTTARSRWQVLRPNWPRASGAVAALLAVALWVLSALSIQDTFILRYNHWSIAVEAGIGTLTHQEIAPMRPGMNGAEMYRRNSSGWYWRVPIGMSPTTQFDGCVVAYYTTNSHSGLCHKFAASMWFAATLCSVGSGLFFMAAIRQHRRKAANRCGACGYLMTGLAPSSPCPECGHPNAKASAPLLDHPVA